jgi:catechol 2,3-dioxygenase-like lactoylglutathione lyase family enzyme
MPAILLQRPATYGRGMQRRPVRYGGRDDTALVVVLDCADLDRSTAFWCGVLGYVGPPAGAPGPYRQLVPAGGDGLELLLQRVPEAKDGKNRVHLDLRVPDLEDELARLLALGARQTTGPVEEDGWTWYVLADPDGNEFCVLQPPR